MITGEQTTMKIEEAIIAIKNSKWKENFYQLKEEIKFKAVKINNKNGAY